jgi:hypothetical protein
MTFHISEEKYIKLFEDIQECVRKNIIEKHSAYELECCAGFGPGLVTHLCIDIESLLKNATDNQINSEIYGLSAEIVDKLNAFMIGLNAIKERIGGYSKEDVVDACNTILDESLFDLIRSKIDVDFPE